MLPVAHTRDTAGSQEVNPAAEDQGDTNYFSRLHFGF
jgi:hypothetical protein